MNTIKYRLLQPPGQHVSTKTLSNGSKRNGNIMTTIKKEEEEITGYWICRTKVSGYV